MEEAHEIAGQGHEGYRRRRRRETREGTIVYKNSSSRGKVRRISNPLRQLRKAFSSKKLLVYDPPAEASIALTPPPEEANDARPTKRYSTSGPRCRFQHDQKAPAAAPPDRVALFQVGGVRGILRLHTKQVSSSCKTIDEAGMWQQDATCRIQHVMIRPRCIDIPGNNACRSLYRFRIL